MSKSAITSIEKACTIANIRDVSYFTTAIKDKEFRKSHSWRNADHLAAFIIASIANAFQCENSDTFADNFRSSIEECAQRYFDANCDDWTGKTWTGEATAREISVKAELDRLQIMVDNNNRFEGKKDKAAQSPELQAFYNAYNDWIKSGAPVENEYGFSTGAGICISLSNFYYDRLSLNIPRYRFAEITNELNKQFTSKGLDSKFPLCSYEEYFGMHVRKTQHLYKPRIEWVKNRATNN